MVENIINKDSKIVFIVESPHTTELEKGYPLAGKAGKKVSKILLNDSSLAFGLIVKEKKLKGKISIINVSKIPLQAQAYGENKPRNIKDLENLKKSIEKRATYSTKHRDNTLNDLKNGIYQVFKEEMEKLPNNIFVVPCGKFAREFCEPIKEDLENKNFKFIEEKILHPSARGQQGWDSLSSKVIEIILSKINP